jgi:TonB-linked SusC/RagA family outer membrane protein
MNVQIRQRSISCMLLLLLSIGQIMAQLSISASNTEIKNVLRQIEEKSDYTFFYSDNFLDLNQKVTINTRNETIENTLNTLFRNTNIAYRINNTQIALSERTVRQAPGVTGQQQAKKTISGTITDNNGETVIGATIVEKSNPTNGTITDIDGNFSLSVAPNAELEISYVGFQPQTISISGRNTVNVILKEDVQTLDEVVVVGYGVQKKVNVIGSIASVDSKKLESRPAPSVSNMLTGQMSGVTIIQGSGSPGNDGGTIRVRGVGSFGAAPTPLVLIDGIPGALNDINPADIENISVLKDASSAAIYGSRAANGVILVQTKQGKEGKISVAYNGSFGWSKATELPELLPSYEYAKYYNLATESQSYSDADIATMRDGTKPDIFANEMYLQDIIGGKGYQTKHETSITGGSDKAQYMLSFGYLNQKGLLEKNVYDRYNARVNLSTKLADNLTLKAYLNGIATDRNEPTVPGGFDGPGQMNSIIGQALRFPGLWPTKMSDGSYGVGPKLLGNPRAWMESTSFYTHDTKKFSSLVELGWQPLESLKLRAIGGYNYANVHEKTFRSTLEMHGGRVMGPSELTEGMGNTQYKTFQFIADYGKVIKKHDFNILAGYTWEDESYRDVNGLRNNFPSNLLPYLTAGATDGQQSWGAGNDWAMMSLIGRLTYNYDQRYLFETTMRYDGSSRFPSHNRFGFFPSVAVGWRISEESFFKQNGNLNFINNLKIKASTGSLGNNNIIDDNGYQIYYPYQQVYELNSNRSYIFGGQPHSGAAVTTYKDPALTWEKTSTTDIGFESNFWNNKLTFNAAYFYRKTTDILYKPSASYSSIFGLELTATNTGSLKNTGWEFEIGHNHRIGDFSYNLSGNFSIINNKVISLGIGNVEQLNGLVGNGTNLFIGYPMQMYYGYKTDGVFLNEQEIAEWHDQSKIASGAKPGDLRYVDVSGDNVVDEKDKVYLGSRIPKYTFGLNVGADYKGFDFSALLQGVAGVKGLLDNYAGFAFFQEGNLQRWQADGSWTMNQNERYPIYPRLETMSNAGTASTITSDFWVLNATYLKVRNIQLGYMLPRTLINPWGLSNLRVYFSADNPFSFSHFRKGWDPEINTSGTYHPILTTYTFGLNLKF